LQTPKTNNILTIVLQFGGKAMKKKWLIRIAVLVGACMAALLVAAPVMAMWDWCDVDPSLSIGGHNVSIQAGIQGDPSLIRGNIVFTVEVPFGTQTQVISCDPGGKVVIQYDSPGPGDGPKDGPKGGPGHKNSKGIPVDVSVDINSWQTFQTRVIVFVDGKRVAQDTATTTRGDLDCQFTIN
jgi:hypothetical protein